MNILRKCLSGVVMAALLGPYCSAIESESLNVIANCPHGCPQCPQGPAGSSTLMTNVNGFFYTLLSTMPAVASGNTIPLMLTGSANQTTLLANSVLVNVAGTYLITYALTPTLAYDPTPEGFVNFSLHKVSDGSTISGSNVTSQWHDNTDLSQFINTPLYGQTIVTLAAGDAIQLVNDGPATLTFDTAFITSLTIAVSLKIVRIN